MPLIVKHLNLNIIVENPLMACWLFLKNKFGIPINAGIVRIVENNQQFINSIFIVFNARC